MGLSRGGTERCGGRRLPGVVDVTVVMAVCYGGVGRSGARWGWLGADATDGGVVYVRRFDARGYVV